jgi:hypothetical protein
MSASDDITALLRAWRAGDAHALDSLLPLVYDELRRLAHLQLERERRGHTLDTTAVVHEATSGSWNRRVFSGRTAPTSSRWRLKRCAESSWITHADIERRSDGGRSSA